MNSRMTKGQKEKIAILNTMMNLIAEHGDTESVAFRDIAERAEISTSKIFYHFKNRKVLLIELRKYVLSQSQETPVASFLEKHRDMLLNREGQALFIDGLFYNFSDYFLDSTDERLNLFKAFRVLIHSTEIHEVLDKPPISHIMDFVAFCEIYQIITGKDDPENATFWYTITFDALALRLTSAEFKDKAGEASLCSKDFDIKLLRFCCRELLMALGLWENSKGLYYK